MLSRGILNEGFVKVLPESQRFVPIYLKTVHQSLPISLNIMTFTGSDSLHKVQFNRSEVFLYIHPLVLFFPLLLLGIWRLRRKDRAKNTEERKTKKEKK
jgi:hypothetical protein